jgi:SP family sugar:H+ symporter-like MFS transporter
MNWTPEICCETRMPTVANSFRRSTGLAVQFIITIVVDCIEVLGVIGSFFIVGRFGRRPLLIYTGIFMFITLLVVGCLGAVAGHGEFGSWPRWPFRETGGQRGKPRTLRAQRPRRGMICLYVFAFNLAWGPIAWVVAAEMSTGRNRQKHLSIGTTCFWISAWAVTFVGRGKGE